MQNMLEQQQQQLTKPVNTMNSALPWQRSKTFGRNMF